MKSSPAASSTKDRCRRPSSLGASVGKIEVKRGGQVVLEAPLFAAESVGEGSLYRKAFDAAYEYVASAIHARLSKKP